MRYCNYCQKEVSQPCNTVAELNLCTELPGVPWHGTLLQQAAEQQPCKHPDLGRGGHMEFCTLCQQHVPLACYTHPNPAPTDTPRAVGCKTEESTRLNFDFTAEEPPRARTAQDFQHCTICKQEVETLCIDHGGILNCSRLTEEKKHDLMVALEVDPRDATIGKLRRELNAAVDTIRRLRRELRDAQRGRHG